VLRAGNTFYSPTPDNRIPHLWIVLSDPDDDGFAICASVTSAQDDSERTTVCKKGDHPLISHESVIFYVDAHEIDMIAVDVALGSTIQGVHVSTGGGLRFATVGARASWYGSLTKCKRRITGILRRTVAASEAGNFLDRLDGELFSSRSRLSVETLIDRQVREGAA